MALIGLLLVLSLRRVCLVFCERLPEEGRQGPKYVGDFMYKIYLFECIRWKLLFIIIWNAR
jgi:hypothetical protein